MADQHNDSTPATESDRTLGGDGPISPTHDQPVPPLEGEDPADSDESAADGDEPAVDAGPPVLTADEETLAAAAIPVRSAVAETEPPRFGAQFSSPEPTAVTARPRRRATRPALSADPDSVEPAPPAAPTLPAFITFVAPAETVTEAPAAPRRRSRRTAAETPADAGQAASQDPQPADDRSEQSSAEPEGPGEGRWAPRRGRSAAATAARETAAREAAGTDEAAQQDEPSAADDRDEPAAGRPAPRRSRSRRRALDPESAEDDVQDAPVASTDDDPDADPEQDPDAGSDDQGEDQGEATDDDRDTEENRDDDGAGTSRRRRRGRRGRGRGRSGEDTGEDDTDDAGNGAEPATADAEEDGGDPEDADADEAETASSTRRRRRRRRRGEAGGTATEDAPAETDERPERAGRGGRTSEDDVVRGIAGSTRLEAKRQRRRDGRDTGRRRAPILSESEFLARREAVDRAMVIRQQGDRTQIAVLEDDILVEHYVTQAQSTSFAGNVYLGRVQNVLPSMEAAFVDIGKGRNAVVYAGEVNWEAAGLTGKSRSIEQAFKSGDKILCQVTKDPIGHKGARLTQQINLPGRFLVYVPGGSMTGISRKLPDNERTRLKDILKTIVPDDAGVIIRTAAEGASEAELTRDVARLQAQWDVIQKKAESSSSAPALLYGEPDLAIRVIRDVFNEDFKRLVVQGGDAWDTVEAYVGHVSPELSPRVQRYTGTGDVFRDLRVDEQLMKALDRKVYLPSGGSLVIDRTEAMTVVDVNTGKFVGAGGGNLEQTVTRNNIEAAEEIVRQLRLRDVGGIIVIDFIDMVLESNRDLVLRRLTECLGRDRTKHQVAEVTSLGLVQMTRKRVGQGLLEVFSEPCEHCRGRGVLVHLDPVDAGRRPVSGSPIPGGPSGSGSNGGGSNGGGPSGSGSNGGGSNGGGGRGGDQAGRARGADRSAARESAAEATPEPAPQPVAPSAGVEVDTGLGTPDDAPVVQADGDETPRGGGRRRGRRSRGQSGEARAAEDAAVIAGDVELVDSAAEPADEPAGDPAGEPVPDGADGPTAEVVELVVAEVPEDAGGSQVIEVPAPVHATDAYLTEIRLSDLQPPADEVTAEQPAEDAPEPEVAVGPEVAPEPEADAEVPVPDAAQPEVLAPQARPRRRRAASRPAGPPA